MKQIHWITASFIFVLALGLDTAHAFYFYEDAQRIPFFIRTVFGQDITQKLLVGSLFALFIIGCEVSDEY